MRDYARAFPERAEDDPPPAWIDKVGEKLECAVDVFFIVVDVAAESYAVRPDRGFHPGACQPLGRLVSGVERHDRRIARLMPEACSEPVGQRQVVLVDASEPDGFEQFQRGGGGMPAQPSGRDVETAGVAGESQGVP
jgi:hypothetical protein